MKLQIEVRTNLLFMAFILSLYKFFLDIFKIN